MEARLTQEAFDTLQSLMRHGATPERIKAASAILEHASRERVQDRAAAMDDGDRRAARLRRNTNGSEG